jgi:hypothetical protein
MIEAGVGHLDRAEMNRLTAGRPAQGLAARQRGEERGLSTLGRAQDPEFHRPFVVILGRVS